MVDRKRPQIHPNTLSKTNSIHNDRCCGLGMGCNNRQCQAGGQLVKVTRKLALQPKRTLGNIRSIEMAGTKGNRNINCCPDGQSYSCCIHLKTRRHKIDATYSNRFQDSYAMRNSSYSPDSSVYSRSIQRCSRQPVTGETYPRMAPQGIFDETNLYHTGYARSRPICNGAFGSSANVCQRSSIGPSQHIHKCFQSNVALQPGLDIPTSVVDSESTGTFGNLNGDIPPNNPKLGEGILVTRSKTPLNKRPMDDTEPREESHRPENEPSTSTSKLTKFAGLEGTGWSNMIASWTPSEIQLLESSWRASTLKTYRPAWEKWCKWTSENNINSVNPEPSDLARYMCFLFDVRKLAPRTIMLHKSVVTTFANPKRRSLLSSHPLISHTIKGILTTKPPIKKPLTWHIEDLIEFMKTYEVDEQSLFAVSRHCSILLLLASGRRVHDLTLLRIDKEHFEDKDVELTFWPIFGSKTDNAVFKQSGWHLRSDPINRLNIVLWVKKLIQLSSHRRKACGLESLFITTRGQVKSASRSVIAGWIKTIFRDASISSSAGSIRAAVATHNWTMRGMNIEEVLKRGNWKSRNTFLNHYFREVPIRKSAVSLNNIFSPLD